MKWINKIFGYKVSFQKLFILESVFFIATLFLYYGYRLYYFYKLDNPTLSGIVTINKKLTINKNISIIGDGLYKEDNTFIFKGKNVNNYIKYSNRLWRIIKINEDGSIKIISDDLVTSLVFNYNDNTYDKSYVRQWLNPVDGVDYSGTFYNSLVGKEDYLTDTKLCVDIITDVDIPTCNDLVTDKVGVLSISDYIKAGANKSYLNNGFYEWTSNSSVDNKVWYIFIEGGLSDNSYNGDSYYSHGVRPIVTLKPNLVWVDGDGSKDDPYIFENSTLKELTVGKYISYNNYNWQIIASDNNKIKLVMKDNLVVNGEYLSTIFHADNNKYNPELKDSVAYYLNNDFYNSLSNKEYIIESDFYNGYYNYQTSYNYNNFKNKVKAHVGLLSIGDIGISDTTDSFLMTGDNAVAETIYITEANGKLIKQAVNIEGKVRPVIFLDGKLSILSGKGTINSPYVLGGK